MTASIEKAKMEKVLESVAKTVVKRAKKFNQPIIVIEDGKIKEIYPYKKSK
ncbi:MAG: hypothetical protein R2760_10940 [Chitinophagales bacterium]|nr:hypothetical protein [Bacteroidota bacterium]